ACPRRPHAGTSQRRPFSAPSATTRKTDRDVKQSGSRSGIRRQAGEAITTGSCRTCPDRRGEKADQGPRPTHCYAHRGSRDRSTGSLPGPFGRRRAPLPACGHFRDPLASMLKGLGNATEDHSLGYDLSSGTPNQLAFNAALAVIDGVRPKDEVE